MPRSSRNAIINETDATVGRRIRQRRLLAGLTQGQLGAEVGVGFQQIWKYERGDSRVSAGRLALIAEVLGMPVAWFFGGDGPEAPAPDFDALRLAGQIARLSPHQRAAAEQLIDGMAGAP